MGNALHASMQDEGAKIYRRDEGNGRESPLKVSALAAEVTVKPIQGVLDFCL